MLRPFALTTAAGLVVAVLAIAFHHWTGMSPEAVLFSGQEAFGTLFADAPTIALSTLCLLLLFKGLAWSVSLGSFRGGPTFPALFSARPPASSPRISPASRRRRPSPC